MGATSDLKAQLGDETAKVRFGLFKKFVTVGEKTVELDQSAGTDEILKAFNLKGSPMSDQLPPVDIVPAEPAKKPAPTPGSFVASIRAMMDEARAGLTQARTDGLAKVGDAVAKLGDAKTAVTQVSASMARTIEDEAASVMAELGQISNMGPE